MKYQIGEQVWVVSKKVVEIINEVEDIAGENVYYTLEGNSYGEKEIDRYYLHHTEIGKIVNRFDCTVKVKPDSLSYDAIKELIYKYF